MEVLNQFLLVNMNKKNNYKYSSDVIKTLLMILKPFTGF